MAGEIEKVRGTVHPYGTAVGGSSNDPDTFVPYQGGMLPMAHHDPEMAVRPPETGSKVQDKWAKNPVVIAIRGTCRAILWITAYWWRTAIAAAGALMIVIIFVYG